MALAELIGYVDSMRSRADLDDLPPRYRGVMLGLAAGNALGLQVEGEARESIEERFPGGVREVDAAEVRRPWDDDLAQAMLLAEALLEQGALDPADVARRLVDWRAENGRGIGVQTAAAIALFEEGVAPADAARRVWEASERKAAGNGALMRCPPVALYFRNEPAGLVQQTAVSAGITHVDPRCIWSAVALNVALSAALAGERPDLAELAELLAGAGAVRTVVDTVAKAGQGFLESRSLDGRHMGYTLVALDVGLWCLARAKDFEDTLSAVVSAGGDTDTNGAVAGACLGAIFGADAIPERWLGRIRDTDLIEETADALCDHAAV